MRTGFQLSQQLNVKMMLKPELQQSLQILQLSGYELEQYLEEQALENPLLEIDPPPASFRERRKAKRNDAGEWHPLARAEAKKETLESMLLGQLRISGVPATLYRIAAFLAGNLDPYGYLAISVAETAALLQQPKELIEQALDRLQALDPAGIGARDLKECLLLQIRRDPSAEPGASMVADQHIHLIAQGKFDKIALLLGISLDEVNRIAAYIRSLKPRPWPEGNGEEPQYVVPDADVRKEDGQCVIRLNPRSLPKLTLNREYSRNLLAAGGPQTEAYVREKVKEANWIVQGLKQRQVTLLRVIQAIFEEQALYLDEGEKALKPLTLRVISEKLQVHESTVSRAVQNKYVRTPYGVMELKFFFCSGLATTAGEYASMKHIKLRLKELISQENKRMPLSDQKIVELLSREGITIARRTVTKYREELHLLSSTLRRSM
jgi:RNA polymerase sigma-54 factor